MLFMFYARQRTRLVNRNITERILELIRRNLHFITVASLLRLSTYIFKVKIRSLHALFASLYYANFTTYGYDHVPGPSIMLIYLANLKIARRRLIEMNKDYYIVI